MVKVRVLRSAYGNNNGRILDVTVNTVGDYVYGSGINQLLILKKDAEVVEDVEKSCQTCGLSLGNRKKDIFCEEVVGICKDYDRWQPVEVIAGVGQDAPTATNEQGGKQSATMYAFDCLDPKAMFAMCKVLKEGRDKYGTDSNWRRIPVDDHLNHLLIHVFAFMAGDTSDDHLSHALCRAMFALAVDDNGK